MESTIKSKQTRTSTDHSKSIDANSQSDFWKKAEFNRFGLISMLILCIGCIGGFAASFGANGNIIKLAMVAFPTIIALAMVLAVAPMKTIVYLSSVAVLIDLIVLIF